MSRGTRTARCLPLYLSPPEPATVIFSLRTAGDLARTTGAHPQMRDAVAPDSHDFASRCDISWRSALVA
jgi:hypothetical protein